ncbi:MAG TPA: DUF5681 domain-containing protein [Rhizomicrobium sp.]
MQQDVGYRRPPVHTRFQKGQSGNPGGRPGPRREMERRFGRALMAALIQTPEELAQSRPSAVLDRIATELVRKAATPDIPAMKFMMSFLPARGEPLRRPRLPAQMLCVAMAEAERADALRQARGEASQGLSAISTGQR